MATTFVYTEEESEHLDRLLFEIWARGNDPSSYDASYWRHQAQQGCFSMGEVAEFNEVADSLEAGMTLAGGEELP